MAKAKTLLALFTIGTLATTALVLPGFTQPGDKKEETKKALAVGDAAPSFSLKDTDGKDVKLDDLRKDGKIVVVFWFNPECPFVVKHFEKGGNTFNDMAAAYKDKKVSIVAINSNAPGEQGSGKETNAKKKKDWKIEFPIALDESGETGRAYGATNTPQCFVIGTDGKIAYTGAIDDDSGAKVGKTNYVSKAVDELLAGKAVTTSSTKPYGCGVKYGKKK
ncbi:MAG: thioredoxin family protein [Tepidisphaera sp.]|jgi:peroxiredoxin